jgi:hypothetical protein
MMALISLSFLRPHAFYRPAYQYELAGAGKQAMCVRVHDEREWLRRMTRDLQLVETCLNGANHFAG